MADTPVDFAQGGLCPSILALFWPAADKKTQAVRTRWNPTLAKNAKNGPTSRLKETNGPFTTNAKVVMSSMAHPILLYDGVCGLCNRLNQFVLRRDLAGMFRFASLQSALAARILARHGADAADLDTVYVVVNPDRPDEHLLARSDAVIFVLKRLGGFWRFMGFLLRLNPRFLRDWGYRIVARNRYRFFGRSETCFLPGPENRGRFLDV
jgi:predicted DCC family thiol-disulfide oxidoreductase YuxK